MNKQQKEQFKNYLVEKKPYSSYESLIYDGLKGRNDVELIKIGIDGLKQFYGVEISTKYVKQFLPSFIEFNEELVKNGKDKIEREEYNKKVKAKLWNLAKFFEVTKKVKFHKEDVLVKMQKEVNIYEYDNDNKPFIRECRYFSVGKEIKRNIPEVLTFLN